MNLPLQKALFFLSPPPPRQHKALGAPLLHLEPRRPARRLSSVPGTAAAGLYLCTRHQPGIPSDPATRGITPRGDRGDAGGHGWARTGSRAPPRSWHRPSLPCPGRPGGYPGAGRGCQQLRHRVDAARGAGGGRGSIPQPRTEPGWRPRPAARLAESWLQQNALPPAFCPRLQARLL